MIPVAGRNKCRVNLDVRLLLDTRQPWCRPITKSAKCSQQSTPMILRFHDSAVGFAETCQTRKRGAVSTAALQEQQYRGGVDPSVINTAIVVAIGDTAVPHIDEQKLAETYGPAQAKSLMTQISELVREAVAMPIEWGDKTLAEGVNDILQRFAEKHPELSQKALHEIGRCVGWNLR